MGMGMGMRIEDRGRRMVMVIVMAMGWRMRTWTTKCEKWLIDFVSDLGPRLRFDFGVRAQRVPCYSRVNKELCARFRFSILFLTLARWQWICGTLKSLNFDSSGDSNDNRHNKIAIIYQIWQGAEINRKKRAFISPNFWLMKPFRYTIEEKGKTKVLTSTVQHEKKKWGGDIEMTPEKIFPFVPNNIKKKTFEDWLFTFELTSINSQRPVGGAELKSDTQQWGIDYKGTPHINIIRYYSQIKQFEDTLLNRIEAA